MLVGCRCADNVLILESDADFVHLRRISSKLSNELNLPINCRFPFHLDYACLAMLQCDEVTENFSMLKIIIHIISNSMMQPDT